MPTFHLTPPGLGAVFGAMVAFVIVSAPVVAVWVALGALFGAGVGFVTAAVRRTLFAREVTERQAS